MGSQKILSILHLNNDSDFQERMEGETTLTVRGIHGQRTVEQGLCPAILPSDVQCTEEAK